MPRELNKVLLVEDDPDIQAVALIALEDIGGLQVVACDSGFEALERAVPFAPDVVLLDVMMPGMTGPETLRALRALPPLHDVPVVFMTAKVQKGEVQEYLSMGAAGVIPKPFEPMTLADELRALVTPAAEPAPTSDDEEERAFRAQLEALGAHFVADLPQRVTELRATFADVRAGRVAPRELARRAHALAGTAATLGLAAVAEIAARIEHDPALEGGPLDAGSGNRLADALDELDAVVRSNAR